MVDVREAILSRLFTVIGGITGVAAVGRNRRDVPGLARPAIVLDDGPEAPAESPEIDRLSRVTVIDMVPHLTILAGDDAVNIGTLLNTLLTRLKFAVLSDAELWGLVSRQQKPAIRFVSSDMVAAGPESKEGRMEVSFALIYVLKLSDLAP